MSNALKTAYMRVILPYEIWLAKQLKAKGASTHGNAYLEADAEALRRMEQDLEMMAGEDDEEIESEEEEEQETPPGKRKGKGKKPQMKKKRAGRKPKKSSDRSGMSLLCFAIFWFSRFLLDNLMLRIFGRHLLTRLKK